MRALSIHQPWAWAILQAGKTVENRTWSTKYRGPLLVHASKSRASYDREKTLDWKTLYGVDLPPWEELVTGAVVGVVDVVDCVSPTSSRAIRLNPWTEGPVCWVLANPRPLAQPVSFRGAQLLFEVADELIPEAVRMAV